MIRGFFIGQPQVRRRRRLRRPPVWALAFGYWTMSLAWAARATFIPSTPSEALADVTVAAVLSIIGWALWVWDSRLEVSDLSGSVVVAAAPVDTSSAADPDFDPRSRGLVVPRSAMRAPRPAKAPHSGSRSGHSFGGAS